MKPLMLCLVSVGFLVPSLAFCQEQEGLEGDPEYQMQLPEMDIERAEQGDDGGGAAVLLILCAVINILVAIWIYQDIRQRNTGSGLWIVLGLLAGLLAALVYAIVRLGDSESGKKRTSSD